MQREIASALRRLPGTKVIAVDIASHPAPAQAARVAQVLDQHRCGALVTVNEWGLDQEGALSSVLDAKNIMHVNWCADDPFFEEIRNAKKYRPSRLRFDFVSDKGYVEPMRERGYRAFFLPLAVDPALFRPDPAGRGAYDHDIVFVGNSYLAQMDDFLKLSPGFIDTLAPFLGSVVRAYYEDVTYDVEGHISQKIGKTKLPPGLSHERALFIAKHAAGYFGRRDIVRALAERYPSFKVFGEKGWLQVLPAERVGTAKYYDSLCDVYRKAKVTIDINRMVIRNGFTQRAFDVPASGGFVITSAKPVVNEIFITSGPQQDMAVFKSRNELMALIDYYLAHEDERLAIAERGMKKVLGGHTYDHRIAEMFRVIQAEFTRIAS
jgi:spore maturation protein CgeB